ncbi:hypothetical protein PanWU01x14_141310 [Parasponia andersonii]|uniref:Uncharacterized protein n=1 Tax=Parasponia andersonii TaxID=3476 RepID=A0A2P5CLL8_PARAD|nr:hypothetical protein PanWU01x14_141310 [Parasponia andersonii]
MSLGTHGLVDSGAHELFLRMAKDPYAHLIFHDAHGLVLRATSVSHANIGIHTNINSYGVLVKNSHVSFKLINSGPLISDQSLSFMVPKNKCVNLDSSKKVVSGFFLDSAIRKGMHSTVNVDGPLFGQVVRASSHRADHIYRGDGSLGARYSQFAQNHNVAAEVQHMVHSLNSNDHSIASEVSKPTIKGNYICVKI